MALNEGASGDPEIPLPLRGVPTEGWRWQDNELPCLFQPIIGPAASALYCHLTGKVYNDKVTYTLRGLAAETKRSRTTIWRALAVLKYIGMVSIRAGGGNQESECLLVNLKKLAVRLGATHSRKSASFVLEPSRAEELRSQIAVLLDTMQAKHEAWHGFHIASRENLVHSSGVNLFLLDSKRDADASPKIRQRPAGETQMESHLLLQNTKHQNIKTSYPPIPLSMIAKRSIRKTFPTKMNRTSWCDGRESSSQG